MFHRKDVVFVKSSIFRPGIADYASAHSTPPPNISHDVWRETQTLCPQWADIATSPLQVSFLCMLVSLLNVRRILEVGTFTGHATVAMAERLPAGGEIVTLDNFTADERARSIATAAFARSADRGKITLLEGDAAESLNTVTGTFDLIFVDADKPSYRTYFSRILDRGLLGLGGLLIFDNTLWGGRVLDAGGSSPSFEHVSDAEGWLDGMLGEWGRHVSAFNRHVAEDGRVETVVLTVQDGMTFVRRTH
jgi:caffeoyl-CoA O-methyltransferase